MLKTPLDGDVARAGQAHGVAGSAAALAIPRAYGGDAALPPLEILVRLYKLDTRGGAPAAQLAQAAIVLVHRLDVGVGPADMGIEALLQKQAHRLERARGAASVQQQWNTLRHVYSLSSRSSPPERSPHAPSSSRPSP